MHTVKNRSNLGWAGIFCRVEDWCRFSSEQLNERGCDQLGVLGLLAADAHECQPVFRHRQVADLPGDMADRAGGLPEPFLHIRLIQEPKRIAASERDLLNREIHTSHGDSTFPAGWRAGRSTRA